MVGVLGYYKLLDGNNRLIVKKNDKRKESYAQVHDFVVCLMLHKSDNLTNLKTLNCGHILGKGGGLTAE